MLGDDLVEALLQSQELSFYTSQKTPVDVQSDVLLLGVLSDGDAFAVGLELVLDDLSVSIVFYTKGVVQHTCDVIVPGDRYTKTQSEETFSRAVNMSIRNTGVRPLGGAVIKVRREELAFHT